MNEGIGCFPKICAWTPCGMTLCVMLSRRSHPRPLFPSFGAPNVLIYKIIGGLPRGGCGVENGAETASKTATVARESTFW
jgi:hypothetical protein